METVCKSCSSNLNGTYCSICGQKVISKRFTLKKSVGWLFANIFNLEKGFLSTTWDLIKKPGKVVSNFLNGITVPYAHPFRFIFVWATVSTLIAVYTGAYDKMGEIGLDMGADVRLSKNHFA
jgi:hypothetical protein